MQTNILNSTLAQTCGPIFVLADRPNWVDSYVFFCADDTTATGMTLEWVAVQMQAIQADVSVASLNLVR